MNTLIECRNVIVKREGVVALDGLNLTIGADENIAILGPNGCGKSTFIKAITREVYPFPMARPSSVKIMGQEIWNIFDLRAHLGIVTNDMLASCTRWDYPGREIVTSGYFSSIGIWPNHEVTPAMEARTDEVMRLLEIEHLAERQINQMSSGESRRFMIGRALIHKPRSILLDEPTNSLDIKSCHELYAILRKVMAHGTSVILVTHHLPDILPEITRVVMLRKGKIFADGPKAEMLVPRKLSKLFQTPVDIVTKDGYYNMW